MGPPGGPGPEVRLASQKSGWSAKTPLEHRYRGVRNGIGRHEETGSDVRFGAGMLLTGSANLARPPPKGPSRVLVNVTVNLPEDVAGRLAAEAAGRGVSIVGPNGDWRRPTILEVKRWERGAAA